MALVKWEGDLARMPLPEVLFSLKKIFLEDPDISFYLRHFRSDQISQAEAQVEVSKWNGIEQRHRENGLAHLRLAVNRAIEIQYPLPDDIVDKAIGLLGPHLIDQFKNLRISTSADASNDAKEEPVLETTHQVDGGDAIGHTSSGVNIVDWISDAISATGSVGIAPSEILKKATNSGIQMHENYPYTVLRKLLAKGKIRRDGRRYYKK